MCGCTLEYLKTNKSETGTRSGPGCFNDRSYPGQRSLSEYFLPEQDRTEITLYICCSTEAEEQQLCKSLAVGVSSNTVRPALDIYVGTEI